MSGSLFDPIRIGSLQLSGRFAKSATIEALCNADGFVTDELIAFYERFAEAGTPLIVTGSAHYSLDGRAMVRQMGLDHDDKIPGLRRLTEAVHRHGTKIFAQPYHCGRQAIPRPVGRTEALSASAVFEPTLMVKPRPMTVAEIHTTIRQHADAAVRCREAGFDGIQIHAAHGYLINQFLTPHTNRRSDEYGGSFENRLRFLLEKYRETRERVGADYPIILKLNGCDALPLRKGLGTDQLVRVAQRMEAEGLDAVEISAGHYESGFAFERGRWDGFFRTVVTQGAARQLPAFARLGIRTVAPLMDRFLNKSAAYSEGFNLPYAREFKRALEIPVMCVGGFVHREAMERAIDEGDCDIVSAARALLADPHLYRHMKEGVRGPECNYCNACYARASALPTDCYEPAIRAEKDLMIGARTP
jgi:2,4-dienoyl-CoA reductase-like NADH-dependent reductase (Old Yellow Enzyme family)